MLKVYMEIVDKLLEEVDMLREKQQTYGVYNE